MNSDLSLFPDRAALGPEIWGARGRSAAHRLLAGAGEAVVVAYREDPTLTLCAVAHGFTADGALLIATTEDELHEALDGDEARTMDVRLSVEKEAPDPSVQIIAAAVHCLAEAEWLTAAEVAELLVTGGLPGRVAEVAAAPGGRVARLSTTRVLLHDSGGVWPISYEEILEQHEQATWEIDSDADLFTSPIGELMAVDVLAAYGAAHMTGLFDALMRQAVPGALLSRQAVETECMPVETMLLCLDVDRTGLTLMRVDGGQAVTAFIAFEQPAVSALQLALELSFLFERAGGA
ncbi:MAG: hypothetical protein Q3979_08335 [Actinomycetaceae bacterium]|nr:hypothetical protein [Actinomycetaceae bacterium]